MRIAFLVTHLLGTGHLARAGQIADAFALAGHDALVLSGGMPAPLASPKVAALHQLPALRMDASFSTMFDDSGGNADADYYAHRTRNLCETLAAFAPDVLITELFPFGRRKLTAEFEAAIAAVPDARVYASIRDILELPSKAGRKEEAEARLERLYDGILFHGDTALVELDESWPLPSALSALVEETGYIANTALPPDDGSDGIDEIIVAAGGGAVGERLFRGALAAAEHRPEQKWRILVGRNTDLGPTPPSVIVERVRPDFHGLLRRCKVALLQCGYNTAMDVAVTGVRAVFCPFEGDVETEQLHRARSMAAAYGCGLIREGALDPARLFAEIDATLAKPVGDFSALRLDGAERSVGIIERAMRK